MEVEGMVLEGISGDGLVLVFSDIPERKITGCDNVTELFWEWRGGGENVCLLLLWIAKR